MDSVTAAFADRPVTSCLVEMRTRAARAMMGVTRLENWIFQHGDPDSAQGREIRARRNSWTPAKPKN